MGLLSKGTPLNWPDTKKHADLLRSQAIKEFLHIYRLYSSNKLDPFKWGDEIEFTLVKFDHENKRARLLLKAEHLLDKLASLENLNNVSFHPEYASYMIESTPKRPFGCDLTECFGNNAENLEANMRKRREAVEQLLDKDEYLVSLTSFPRLGCPDFIACDSDKCESPELKISESIFYPDNAIYSGHPRFRTLTRNIRERRSNNKVNIQLPIFVDLNTPRPFREASLLANTDLVNEDFVYLDATGFGMGCCCLQVTFQSESIQEARYLYDQLTPFTPLLLALSASSPIWRGYLTDVDCRWNVISGSVDDRTKEEMGIEPLKIDRYVIPKSRYDSIDSYLSAEGGKYNDINIVKDESIYEKLLSQGIDHLLAQHIAHLFIRDPLVLFKEKSDFIVANKDCLDANTDEVDNFENIQSMNWQTMRFKPPPILDHQNIGWRVEFRPIELQFTEYENAAFCFFVIFLTRCIKNNPNKLNFLMPISKVDENMKRAQLREACRTQKFWFRRNIYEEDGAGDCHMTEMSLDEIFNGTKDQKGLISILKEYLDTLIDLDQATRDKLTKYLDFIKRRADLSLKTPASYMRDFVQQHAKYLKDSVVSDEINYDLLWQIHLIQSGQIKYDGLF